MHNYEYTKAFLDAEYQKCEAGTLGYYDNLDGEVGSVGSCHPGDIEALNEAKRSAANAATLADLEKPIFHTVLLLFAVCAIWILVPLVDRSKTV